MFRLLTLLVLLPAWSAFALHMSDSAATESFDFLPGSATVSPLLAHPQEPRVGVRKEIGSSRLKLDIGTGMDVVRWQFGDSRAALAAGIDFFTYGLTTSSEGLRLQVDAVDGFFGGHVAATIPSGAATWGVRLRLLHLSAHMVDGHYDRDVRAWKDGREPLPFTRDFGELTGLLESELGGVPFRIYAGFSYATLVRPVTIRRFAALQGIEVHTHQVVPALLGRPFTLYAAAHLDLAGIPAWAGTATIETGVKFGSMYGRGVRLYASLQNGPEIFSQYFDLRTRVWGLGFAFDAW